jgi:general secretion pathway protein D
MGGFLAGVGLGPTRDVKVTSGTTTSTVKVNALNAMIKAVASHSSTNILATPQILALDNTEATFEVGDTVQVRNSTVVQNVQNFSSTPQEAKLSLKITPQINKVTRFVKLKINQKIDDFKSGEGDPNSGVGLPTTTRTAITEVMVRDRDTIAMGGLLRDREIVSNSKVPILGDIPVLGWLFKNKSRTVEKVNILFFMTPKILAPYAKTASVNTKGVLERRTQGMKQMFSEGEIDPNAQVSKDLSVKLDQQVKGPLYDLSDADHYKNLNKEDIGPDPDAASPEEVQTPDYQEIIKSVQ